MLKMHQFLFIKFLFLSLGTFVLFSIISYVSIKSIIIEENKTYLQKMVSLLSLDINRVENLDLYAKNINESTSIRVTIIGLDGNVLAESNADKNSMQNHANRDEIIQAKNSKTSFSVRFSHTLKIDFLYVAKKVMYKGKTIYLRLATPLSRTMKDFYSLLSKLAIIFTIILIILFYISKHMGNKVLYDIKQLKNYLDEVSLKNYEAVVHIKYFQEFLEISLLLKNLIKRLNNKEKKK